MRMKALKANIKAIMTAICKRCPISRHDLRMYGPGGLGAASPSGERWLGAGWAPSCRWSRLPLHREMGAGQAEGSMPSWKGGLTTKSGTEHPEERACVPGRVQKSCEGSGLSRGAGIQGRGPCRVSRGHRLGCSRDRSS